MVTPKSQNQTQPEDKQSFHQPSQGQEHETNDDTIRLAIITLLVAIYFYIINFSKGVKFEELGIPSFLKAIATVFYKLVLPILILYIVTLGITKTYKKTRIQIRYYKALKSFLYVLYDLGLALMAVVVFVTIVFFSGIWFYENILKHHLIPKTVVVLCIIGGGTIFVLLFKKHIDDILEKFGSFLKKLKDRMAQCFVK